VRVRTLEVELNLQLAHVAAQLATTQAAQQDNLALRQSLRSLQMEGADFTAALESERAAHQSSRAEGAAEIKELSEELQATRAELDEAHRSLSASGAAAHTLRTAASDAAELRQALHTARAAHVAEIAALRAEIAATRDNGGQQLALAQSESRAAALAVQAQTQECARLSAELKEARVLLEQQRLVMRDLDTTRSALLHSGAQRAEEQARLADAEASLAAEREARSRALEDITAKHRAELQELQAASSASALRLHELAAKHQSLEARALSEGEESARRLRNAEARVNTLQAEAQESLVKLTAARRAAEAARSLQTRLDRAVEQLAQVEGGLEAVVTCTACTGLFRDPVSLPCGHTVCRACLLPAAKSDAAAGGER